MADRTMTLPDGRTLAWCEYGPSGGTPVMLFHGTPGSRLDHDSFETPTTVRTIVPDRPGFGLSGPQPGRRLSDWPADVAALADELGLERFHVAGISGGGPYALACAALLPDRVIGAGVICGVGPLHLAELRAGMNEQNTALDEIARNDPAMLHTICAAIAADAAADPAAFVESGRPSMPAPDQAVLDLEPAAAMLRASITEAFRQGGAAFAEDLVIHSSPWEFDLASIRCHVEFVHGRLDVNVPPSHAEFLAGVVPDSHLEMLDDEGHLSVAVLHSVALVTRLVG